MMSNKLSLKIHKAVANFLNNDINITDTNEYSLLQNDENMIQLTKEASSLMILEENFKVKDVIYSYGTDMIEPCNLIPIIIA